MNIKIEIILFSNDLHSVQIIVKLRKLKSILKSLFIKTEEFWLFDVILVFKIVVSSCSFCFCNVFRSIKRRYENNNTIEIHSHLSYDVAYTD